MRGGGLWSVVCPAARRPLWLRRVGTCKPLSLWLIERAIHSPATFVRQQKRADDDETAPEGVQEACMVLARHRWRDDPELVVNLAYADLRGVSLERAALRGVILKHARMEGAFLRHSDLRDANLTNAIAPSVRLDDAQLGDALLTGAVLEGANA